MSFLGNEERSSVAFGANPSWNEQVELSWTMGLSKMLCGVPTLSKEEFIYINIFDEDLIISNETDAVFTSQAMKNWIGGLTVPLSSLMTRGTVEGTQYFRAIWLQIELREPLIPSASLQLNHFGLNIDSVSIFRSNSFERARNSVWLHTGLNFDHTDSGSLHYP